MGYSKSDNTQFCSFSILEKRVLQTLLLACKKRKKFKTRFVSHINTKARPCRLRGSQLGQEKLVAKVSIMGKKAPGILLLMNQFHNLFAVFMIFLYEEVHPQTRLLAVPVWLVQDSFLRDEFLVKWDPRNQRNSIIGKIYRYNYNLIHLLCM